MSDIRLPERLEFIDPKELIANQRNPKTHSPDQIALLCGLITEFGFTKPVLISQRGHDIIAGHGATVAAVKLNMPLVPVVRAGSLNREETSALIVSDNKVAEYSEWDKDVLQGLFQEMDAIDPAILGLTGFNFEEIAALIDGNWGEGDEEEEDKPKIHTLTCGSHKIQITVEERDRFSAVCAAWVKKNQSYNGLAEWLINKIESK